MNFFISPKELPKKRVYLFGSDAIPDMIVDEAGADFMLITNRGIVVLQRKTILDLIASVKDGRLAQQLPLMRKSSEFPILLVEGHFRYSRNGQLLNGRGRNRRWTKDGIRNLLRTVKYVELIDVEYSDSLRDTVRIIYQTQKYFDTKQHLSTKGRASISKDWIVPTYQERLIYFYQGLPGLGVARAKVLSEHFKSSIDLHAASVKDITAVPGFSKSTATVIYDFLRGTYGSNKV